MQPKNLQQLHAAEASKRGFPLLTKCRNAQKRYRKLYQKVLSYIHVYKYVYKYLYVYVYMCVYMYIIGIYAYEKVDSCIAILAYTAVHFGTIMY